MNRRSRVGLSTPFYTLKVRVEEQLQSIEDKIKNFKGIFSDSSSEDNDCDDSEEN